MKPLPVPFAESEKIREYIEAVIRNAVIYNWTEYTRRGVEHKGQDWELMCQAIDRISLFKLVEDGVFSYQELGVQTYNGVLPFWIVQEHITMRNIYGRAYAEKAKLDKK